MGVGVTTRTSTSSCRAAASRRTDSAGSHAALGSFCPFGSSRVCSAACSWSKLSAAYHAGQLQFFGDLTALADATAFSDYLAPLRRTEWVAFFTPSGHSAARRRCWPICPATPTVSPVANSRIVAFNDAGVTFKWKDYRDKQQPYGKVMTLAIDEFIRRFLIHVLPSGFHRIRHYGLFANGGRAENITRARRLLDVPKLPPQPADTDDADGGETVQLSAYPCPCCGGRLIIIETFERGDVHRDIIQRSASGSTAHDCYQIRITVPSCRNWRFDRSPATAPLDPPS